LTPSLVDAETDADASSSCAAAGDTTKAPVTTAIVKPKAFLAISLSFLIRYKSARRYSKSALERTKPDFLGFEKRFRGSPARPISRASVPFLGDRGQKNAIR